MAAIEEVIKGELKPRSYYLETEEHEYDRLEDIPEDLEQASDFLIMTLEPFVIFRIDSLGARLSVDVDGAKTLGVLHQIEAILRKNEEKSDAPSVVNFGYAKKPASAKEVIYVKEVASVKEPQNFLKRNKDLIIVVAAVVSAIAALFALF